VTVGGVLEATRIFSPDVALLDAEGHTTRTFRAADYYYRGPVFSVQFQPKAAERYLLVAADPARVGQRYDAINIGTQTTTVPAGVYTMTWTRGTDTKTSRTFSYEVSGLDPSVPGYCFTVGAVVAWGSPSQVSWSQPRCTPGAKVVTPTPDPSGS